MIKSESEGKLGPVADGFAVTTFDLFDPSLPRTRSRAEFVYESLRDAISDGRIVGGERVREEDVARNLGVSRTPVREALQRLQQRGTFGRLQYRSGSAFRDEVLMAWFPQESPAAEEADR